jgi:2-keto-4-pentenoate hydratase/2-oxohepta-3-ene-1,7-dioic acid hydratase in catechol pathway
MRIIRFVDVDGHARWGLDRGDGTADLLAENAEGGATLAETGRRGTVRRLLAPVNPVNIFCIGLNYREHAKESGSALPENPVLFMKPTTAVIGSGDPIRIPGCCTHGPEVDYECELAVVIGKAACDVSEEQALDHVLGYTGANDVSARRWQRHNGGQWVRAKSFDSFCPLGPALVTAQDIPDPQRLTLRTVVNGKVMQEHSTSDMIFSVAQIISFLSQDTTLLPGTLILTGTPQGVGFARKPPVFLAPGDQVEIEIEKIGRLVNPVA